MPCQDNSPQSIPLWKTLQGRTPSCLARIVSAGFVVNFTGIDSAYEEPESAELVLKTDDLSLEECVAEVLKLV